MRTVWIKLISLVVLITILNACGTKGPLYIPEQRYPQETPQQP
jgi:predicted small lipoprotein YifL